MLSRMSIRQKLLFALGTILVMLGALSAYDYFKIKSMTYQVEALLDHEVKLDKDLALWRNAIEKNIIRTRVLSLVDNPTLEKNFKEDMMKTSKDVSEIQSILETSLQSEKSKALFLQVQDVRKIYSQARSEFLTNKASLGDITYEDLEAQYQAKVQVNAELYMAKINELINSETQSTRDSQKEIIANLENFQKSLLLTTALAIIIGLALAIVISNSIVSPIKKAIDFANEIAKGNLNASLENKSRDEVGKLVFSLQQMSHNLRTMVQDVRSSSSELFTSSTEIAAGNTDLSQRTEAVAASLQEAAASVEQFTQTINQTSENSKDANKMSKEAFSSAQIAGMDMKKFNHTMLEINKSSEQIGDIIEVIDDIAFQTNLLALNAAVEAARAGENGRGFSVVASEVRLLAKRTSDSAKEIKDLILASQYKVKAGTQEVCVASRNIETLITHIQSVNEIVSEITSSTQEQSLGIRQINEVISHIDESTQKNAALVEESSAATDSMKSQTNHLNQLVGQFTL